MIKFSPVKSDSKYVCFEINQKPKDFQNGTDVIEVKKVKGKR